jgi:hypothetical protein
MISTEFAIVIFAIAFICLAWIEIDNKKYTK